MTRKIFIYLIITLLTTACTSYSHKKPESVTIENEKFINLPKDKVWSAIFNQLYNDPFNIVTLDKKQGIIVATFKTDRPANYIDCGVVKTNYRDEEKRNHKYTYNYAESTNYLYDKEGRKYDAKVTANLEATVTAKIIELEQGNTITVDVDYILKREITPTNTNDNTTLPIEKEQFKFTTKEPYKTEEISCISTGAIEHNLLDHIH